MKKLSTLLLTASFVLATATLNAQSVYNYNGSGSLGAWLTPANWRVGGVTSTTYPGVAGAANPGTATDIASFGSNASGVGINLNSANGPTLELGAITVVGTLGMTISQSSTTGGLGTRNVVLNGALAGNSAGLATNTILDATGANLSLSPGSASSRLGVQLGITNGIISAATGKTVAINVAISEKNAGSGFTKEGAGTLTLSAAAANSYTGTTTLNAGTIQVFGNYPNNGTLGATTAGLTVNGGTLDLNATSQTVGAVSGSGGTITNANGTASTLTFGTVADNTLGSAVDGNLALVKNGSGIQTLTGTNGYTGTTTVNNGALRVNGTHSGTGAFTVNSNGTLAGTGSIAASVGVTGGKFSAGTATTVGSLATGALSLTNSATFALDINTNLKTTDLTTVSGDFTLDPNSSTVLAVTDRGTDATLNPGDLLRFVTYSGAWNGGLFSLNGTVLNNGDQFTLGSNTYQIAYDAGTATAGTSAVQLTTVVPEPATYALFGMGLLVCAQRFRRRSSRA